jgi:putative membrane protein
VLTRYLARLAFNVVALYVAAWAISGITYGDKWWSLLIAAAVFTLVNMFIKPIVNLLSLPFIIVTLGLFLLLVNVFMLYITDWLVDDFEIASFGAGLLGAIVVSIVNWILSAVIPGEQ